MLQELKKIILHNQIEITKIKRQYSKLNRIARNMNCYTPNCCLSIKFISPKLLYSRNCIETIIGTYYIYSAGPLRNKLEQSSACKA